MRLSLRKVGREVLRRGRRLGLVPHLKGRQLRRSVLNKDRRKRHRDQRGKGPLRNGSNSRNNRKRGSLLHPSSGPNLRLRLLSREPSLRLRRRQPRLPLLPGRCPKRRCKNLRW